MASGRLVDYLSSGFIAARPLAPNLTPGSIGYWWSTDILRLDLWDGAAWINGVSGGGVVQSIVAGTNVTVDATDPANPIVSAAGGGGGSGDVVGPASSVDSHVALFDGVTGKKLKDGGKTIAELSAPKITSTVTSNTITPAGDTDLVRPSSTLSAGLTIANPSGTPADGWGMVLELKDNGTTRSLTWGSKFAGRCATLPTATTAGKQHVVGVTYNATDDKLYCDYALVQP